MQTFKKQGAHKHQPTARPLPHACAQPYHAGSGSHGQLFRPYWGSSAWHSRRSVSGENPCIKDPFLLRREVPAPHNTCGSCWLGTAPQFSHDVRGEGGSWAWCMCAPCVNWSFENSELNCSTALRIRNPDLTLQIFRDIDFCPSHSHKLFCVTFSGLTISKLKILDKSY